jgi:hypothetical protein
MRVKSITCPLHACNVSPAGQIKNTANHAPIHFMTSVSIVHDGVKAGVLKLVPVASVDNVELLTKPLQKAAFLTLQK